MGYNNETQLEFCRTCEMSIHGEPCHKYRHYIGWVCSEYQRSNVEQQQWTTLPHPHYRVVNGKVYRKSDGEEA